MPAVDADIDFRTVGSGGKQVLSCHFAGIGLFLGWDRVLYVKGNVVSGVFGALSHKHGVVGGDIKLVRMTFIL